PHRPDRRGAGFYCVRFCRRRDQSRERDLRAVLNAIFYLLRTGCQWRLLAREFPPCEFLALHPDLEMEVILDDRVIDLVEEGTDVSLRMGAVADSTMDRPQAGA